MAIGRPRDYKTVAAMRKKINNYFKSITITRNMTERVIDGYELDEFGKEDKTKPIYKSVPVLNNLKEPITYQEYVEKPSIIRMCLYLEIDRGTLIYYENNPIKDEEGNITQQFSHTIKKARDKIEAYKADQLDRVQGQVTGIIFDLKNNHGWVDKTENVNTNKNYDFEKELLELEE